MIIRYVVSSLGLEVIDELLSPAEKKLIFVSVWFSFTVALFLLNRLNFFLFWPDLGIKNHQDKRYLFT